ncbi:nucleoside-diphosphate sugar epimerase [Timonella sp. A28]|uniref:nucleoside-diphosphate sugar epimerase n=1 Tax=Timonella sp. A28 TaxID=3442640 RepID=UPI003EBC83CC
MANIAVHSERTGRAQERPDFFVVGDSPMARGVREHLGARRVSDKSKTAHRFVGARVVVSAAHYCDFESIFRQKQERRRNDLVERAEQLVVDAVIGQVERLIIISSAMVNGQRIQGDFIDDDEELSPVIDGFVGDITVFELALAAALERTPVKQRPQVTILRPTAAAGTAIDTLVTRHFEAPRILLIRGIDKGWQFVHVSDIARAVVTSVDHELNGALVLGATRFEGEDAIPDELFKADLLRITGMRDIELSEEAAFATATRLHRVGVLPAPASDMETAVYPWSVTSRRLLEAGWRPSVSSEECLTQLMEEVRGKFGVGGRRVGHKDAAALGAAGAAVALLSTAAIWRQSRGKR